MPVRSLLKSPTEQLLHIVLHFQAIRRLLAPKFKPCRDVHREVELATGLPDFIPRTPTDFFILISYSEAGTCSPVILVMVSTVVSKTQ
jgi:hypothetical protein